MRGRKGVEGRRMWWCGHVRGVGEGRVYNNVHCKALEKKGTARAKGGFFFFFFLL